MKKLDEQIGQLLEEAAARDAEVDRSYGKGRRGDELPEELRDSKKRAERLREAARQLEADKKLALGRHGFALQRTSRDLMPVMPSS